MMWSTGSKEQGIDWELLGSSANIDSSRIAYGGAPNTYDNYMGQFVKDWYAEGEETLPPTDPPTPTPTPIATSIITPDPTPVQGDLGDVDSDGDIDIVDALLIAQYYVNLNPNNFNPGAADVDCDNQIDIVDALLVAQYYVGLIDQFCQDKQILF
jgi:hypothetical protein